MEKIINEIFMTLTSNYGVFGALLIISFTLSVLYGFVSFIKQISGTVIKSKFWKRKNMNLKNHQTFLDLDFLIKHKLHNVNTICQIRKKLYIDIVTEKISRIKEELQKFVKEDLNKLSNKQFYLKVQSVLDDAKNQSTNNLKSNGVPQFILDTIDNKLSLVQYFYQNQIKGYCYNNYLYSNNTERMCAILDCISVSIECYMNLLEQSLSEFNGDVKKLKYNGVSCNKCHICVHDKYLSDLKQ